MSYCRFCDCNVGADKDTALHAAVEKNDEAAVRRLLAARGAAVNEAVNAQNSRGQTPLHLAATVRPRDFENGRTFGSLDERELRSKLRIAELLIEAGANVNGLGLSAVEPNRHFPVLLEAAACQNEPMIELLLRHGADMNADSPEGRENALFWAVVASDNGDARVVERLLESGIAVNAANEPDGKTALHWAVESETCSVELLEALLRHGADVNARDVQGKKPCQEYIFYHSVWLDAPSSERGLDPRLLSLLLPSEEKIGPLREACLLHRHELVRELIGRGADVAARDEFGLTPLYYALVGWGAEDKSSTVRALLDHGADINDMFVRPQPANYAESALGAAARTGNLEVVRILLEHAAKLLEVRALSEFNVRLIFNFEELRIPRSLLLHDWAALRKEFVDWCTYCAEEVRAMRATKVGESSVCYLDLLNVDLEKTTLYARNGELVEAFESDRRAGRFPIYRRLLDAKFDAGLERRKLIDGALFHLSVALSFVHPIHFLETTLTRCTNEDLKLLLDSAPASP